MPVTIDLAPPLHREAKLLEENILDAYRLMMEDNDAFPTTGRQTKELAVEV